MLVCAVLLYLAYIENYESLRLTTNIVVVFLISLNVIANFLQVIGFIESHIILATNKKRDFSTKSEYNEEVIKELESRPRILRAIVVGPYFLHPKWVIDRRLKLEDRKSFSLALRTYLEEPSDQSERKVRLIVRNSPRYFEYLKPLVKPKEVQDLVHEMQESLDNLLKSQPVIFCCANVGYYENVMITEKSCFIYGRKTEVSPIELFWQLKDQEKIKEESDHFDKIFDANYKGRDEEIACLKQFIASLEQRLTFNSKSNGNVNVKDTANETP